MICSFNRLSFSNTFGVLGVLGLRASGFGVSGFKDSGFKVSGFGGVSGFLSGVETKSLIRRTSGGVGRFNILKILDNIALYC